MKSTTESQTTTPKWLEAVFSDESHPFVYWSRFIVTISMMIYITLHLSGVAP